MISVDYARLMARYNEWQNRSLYAAADMLTEEQRRLDRGAFFGSIFDTLNHLLWGDQVWMSRFARTPKPLVGPLRSRVAIDDWSDLKTARADFDAVIVGWASTLDPDWLTGDLKWFSGAAGREMVRPRWQLVAHLFNHQTHHRGQVHAMLTAAGAKPDDTDLMLLDPAESASP
ncbi:MAG: damage-inducible protein DinB [Rhizobiales bacterium 65-9]|nr:DinB family protein [Hyphomicrobiales bacterium]OJY34749.1 MAG: damage-inducible protein DinB [Rhizobiales bacterium 65-9]